MKHAIKQKILEQARRDGVQVTALREQVLDIVLQQSGVIKAYNVLSQMQQQSEGVVAPPTAYRALDFWAEQGVLHKVAGGQRAYFLHARAHHHAPRLICGQSGAFCTKGGRSTAIFCAATRSTSATTIATTTKKPKRTTARLFWSAPNAARRTSKP